MQGFKIRSSNYPLSQPTQALDGWVDGVNLFKEAGRKIKREEREKKERRKREKGENTYSFDARSCNIHSKTRGKTATLF